jgi:N-methylhydantoinase A
MLMVDVVHDYAQTDITGLEGVDIQTINEIYAGLLSRGQQALADDGFDDKHRAFIPSAEMRYQGQEHTVNVRMPGQQLGSDDDVARVVDDFNAAHQRQYGHSMMDDPVEIVTLRRRALGLLPRPDLPRIGAGTGDVDNARKGVRPVYRYEAGEHVDYLVYERDRLLGGDRIEGPAIVEEPSSTTVFHAGDVLTVGEYGELVIDIA